MSKLKTINNFQPTRVHMATIALLSLLTAGAEIACGM